MGSLLIYEAWGQQRGLLDFARVMVEHQTRYVEALTRLNKAFAALIEDIG